MLNIREAFKNRGFSAEDIQEALQNAEDLRTAGYNEETVEAMCEGYLADCDSIEGEFTLEKLMMTIDSEQAFADFWEDTNA